MQAEATKTISSPFLSASRRRGGEERHKNSDAALPRVEDAVSSEGPAVDEAADSLVDDAPSIIPENTEEGEGQEDTQAPSPSDESDTIAPPGPG